MAGASFMPSAEEVDKQLEEEFRDEVQDTLGRIEVLLGNVTSESTNGAEALGNLRRDVLSLVTQGRALHLPLLNLATHQLYDYLAGLETLTEKQCTDVQTFADKLQDILDGKVVDTADTGAKMVRELPVKTGFDVDFGDIAPQDVQIMVVVPERAMTRIIEREMAACGIRTTNVRDPFQAFEMALRIKPDVIIAARELSAELSGIDLACAFAAMPATQQTPFAMLSSYDWGHSALRGLPQRAALLKKGPSFGEDLAQALERFDIF